MGPSPHKIQYIIKRVILRIDGKVVKFGAHLGLIHLRPDYLRPDKPNQDNPKSLSLGRR